MGKHHSEHLTDKLSTYSGIAIFFIMGIILVFCAFMRHFTNKKPLSKEEAIARWKKEKEQ